MNAATTTTTRPVNALERLAERHRYATRYELVADNGRGKVLLVGYCHAKARMDLLKACQRCGESLVAAFGLTRDAMIRFEGKSGAWSAVIAGHGMDAVTVRFTGRTEREAISSGEWPRVIA